MSNMGIWSYILVPAGCGKVIYKQYISL